MKYAIPTANMTTLVARLEKVNKRALKLGADPIGYKVLDRFEGEDGIVRQWIEINGEVPAINGWVLDANVEYLDNGEVVKSMNRDFVCPDHYRGTKPFCEHCNTHKVKRYSTILRHTDTGEYKMVGKTCLADFLGDDIEGIVRRQSYLYEIINEIEDPESDLNCGGGESYYGVDTIMEYAAHYTLIEGYKNASWEDESTRAKATTHLFPKYAFVVDEETKAYVAAAKEWIMDQPRDTDFMINLQNLINSQFVNGRMLGLVVGGIGAYAAHIARDAKKKMEAMSIRDEYFGELKKRYTLDVTLVGKFSIETMYGTTWIHTFVTDDGYKLVWFGSRPLRDVDGVKVEEGKTIKIKATVVDHALYKDEKQTKVNRVAPAK